MVAHATGLASTGHMDAVCNRLRMEQIIRLKWALEQAIGVEYIVLLFVSLIRLQIDS